MAPPPSLRPPVPPMEIRLIWARRRIDPEPRPALHYRAGVTVWHLEKGAVSLRSRKKQERYKAPCWLLLGTGWNSHTFEDKSVITSISMLIQSPEGPMLRLPPDLAIHPPGAMIESAQRLMRLHGQRAQADSAADMTVHQLLLHSAVADWSLHLGRLLRKTHPEVFPPPLVHPGLRQAMRWLHERTQGERVREPEMAKAGGLSVSHFKRVFQQELGIPPREYLRQQKVNSCVEALLHTDKSVKQIGHELGYSEPTNFVRWFRQHFRQTPGEYRTAHAAYR